MPSEALKVQDAKYSLEEAFEEAYDRLASPSVSLLEKGLVMKAVRRSFDAYTDRRLGGRASLGTAIYPPCAIVLICAIVYSNLEREISKLIDHKARKFEIEIHARRLCLHAINSMMNYFFGHELGQDDLDRIYLSMERRCDTRIELSRIMIFNFCIVDCDNCESIRDVFNRVRWAGGETRISWGASSYLKIADAI